MDTLSKLDVNMTHAFAYELYLLPYQGHAACFLMHESRYRMTTPVHVGRSHLGKHLVCRCTLYNLPLLPCATCKSCTMCRQEGGSGYRGASVIGVVQECGRVDYVLEL